MIWLIWSDGGGNYLLFALIIYFSHLTCTWKGGLILSRHQGSEELGFLPQNQTVGIMGLSCPKLVHFTLKIRRSAVQDGHLELVRPHLIFTRNQVWHAFVLWVAAQLWVGLGKVNSFGTITFRSCDCTSSAQKAQFSGQILFRRGWRPRPFATQIPGIDQL
jgi:hypothetical protein